jgi:hypothetical protein
MLTPSEAEIIINGLRGWARFRAATDPDAEQDIPCQDHDPWPEDMAEVADKIQLAMQEATER